MRIKIKGMHCGSCESLIEDILAGYGVEVSADDGKLEFEYEGDTGPMIKEIREAGFRVET